MATSDLGNTSSPASTRACGGLALDYVDIFYHHHFDPETPLEESLGALHTAVTSGKALYVGISSYSDKRTAEAVAILRQLGTPLLIHQPSYSMFNRWIEDRLLDVLGRRRSGVHRLLCLGAGTPHRPIPQRDPSGLQGLSWVARSPVTCSTTKTSPASEPSTTLLRGEASPSRRWPSPGHCATLESRPCSSGPAASPSSSKTSTALDDLEFTADEIATIDRYAVDGGIDLWRTPATS